MWIENVAAADIPVAFHHDAGPNSMLIQISDMGSWWPTPKFQFKEVHRFEFFDVERGDEDWRKKGITENQAKAIADLLTHAYTQKMNVVVHCMAGLCRSGAVVEVGIMMGFIDTEKLRIPNLLVKERLTEALGISNIPVEIPANWRFFDIEKSSIKPEYE